VSRTLILGLGNDILGDDSFGLRVARRLAGTPAADLADIAESSASGFRLLDSLEGYDRAVIIDSYLAPDRPMGEVIELDISDAPGRIPSKSSHFYSFPQALAVARGMGMHLPQGIKAFCAVIHEYRFSESGFDPALEGAAGEIMTRTLKYVSAL
jgi:hydrogenase maturation protease